MSRIIKFRAWDTVRCIMFNPDFLELEKDGYARSWWGNPGATGIGYNAILMQFTGLLDKNGKEIFEGDIVKTVVSSEWDEQVPRDEFGIVEWMGDGWWVKSEGTPDNHRLCDYDWEVVNNIYEKDEG